MREIKFRAWNKDMGWIFGGIVHQTDHYGDEVDDYYIIEGDITLDYNIGESYKVKKETVGQFTGLFDKKDKELYEGDIVQAYIGKTKHGRFYIKYINNAFIMAQNEEDTNIDCCWFYDFEIIGNIYENPELINQ